MNIKKKISVTYMMLISSALSSCNFVESDDQINNNLPAGYQSDQPHNTPATKASNTLPTDPNKNNKVKDKTKSESTKDSIDNKEKNITRAKIKADIANIDMNIKDEEISKYLETIGNKKNNYTAEELTHLQKLITEKEELDQIKLLNEFVANKLEKPDQYGYTSKEFDEFKENIILDANTQKHINEIRLLTKEEKENLINKTTKDLDGEVNRTIDENELNEIKKELENKKSLPFHRYDLDENQQDHEDMENNN